MPHAPPPPLFRRLRARPRAAGIAAAAVAVVLVAVMARAGQVAGTSHGILLELHALRENIAEAESATRWYLLSGDDAALADYRAAEAAVAGRLMTLPRLLHGRGHEASLEGLRTAVDARLLVLESLAGSRRELGMEAVLPFVGRGRAIGLAVAAHVGEIVEREQAAAQRASRNARAAARFGAALALLAIGGVLAAAPRRRRGFALERPRPPAGSAPAAVPVAPAAPEPVAALRAGQESEDRFRRIAESNMIGVTFWSLDGGVTYANDAFLRIVGHTRADLEMQRIDWRAMTPPEWAAVDAHALAELRENGVTHPFEKEYLRTDGGRARVLLSAATFTDDPQRGVSLVVDLTERRRSERELADARHRLRLALDSASLGTWEIRFDDCMMYRDARACEILADPRDGWLDVADAASILYGGDAQAFLQLCDEVRAGTRAVFELEARVPCGDGSIRWTAWTGLVRPGEDGSDALRIVGTVSDVTHVRAAREMLRASEDRFRIITEAMPQIVWTARADGRVDWYNQRWCQFSGAPRAIDAGTAWRPVVHAEDRAATVTAWRDAVATGGDYEVEHRVRAVDGSFRWLLTRCVPLRDDAGNVIRWFGTATDIHEQKLAQVELLAARDAAESASRAKSQFLAIVSHELRTPLTAVIGYADLLDTEVLGPLSEKQKKPLERIRYSAWHLVGVIDEILTFSRADAGREVVHPEDTDAADIVRGVLALLETEARSRGVNLAGELSRPVRLNTDARKLRQIMLNLVGNALKFTDAGEVRVSLEEVDGGRVTIRVRDTGPGIPSDQLDRIFEPFTQADDAHTREKGGTGLGLAVSRRLARLLGGDVNVDSSPGAGSTFSVTLPR